MSTGSIVLGRGDVGGANPYARRLLWARAIAVLMQSLLFMLAIEYPGTRLVLWLLSGALAVAALASMLGLQQLRHAGMTDDAELFRHVLADQAVLIYLLALSGGAANPFHDAYFLPVAVAAATMSSRYAWRVVGASMVGYTILHVVDIPLPGADALGPGVRAGAEWMTHALLSVLALHFLSQMRTHLRQRERQLAEVREASGRAECAFAVGSIAAGAAHELSTPVMTINTALETLLRAPARDPALTAGLETIAGGVRECRRTLEVLRQASAQWSPSEHAVPVREFVGDIVARFLNMHPSVPLTRRFEPHTGEPEIIVDLALQQAVINLLTNAAQASPAGVSLTVGWDEDEVRFRVNDRGPGIAPDLLDKLGNGFVSRRPGGHGMGLFLTQLTAQRLGGYFRIANAPTGGAVAEIVLPLPLLRLPRKAPPA